MKQASLTKLRQNLSEFLNAVNTDHEPLVVTRRRGQPVVMISLEDYEAMARPAHAVHQIRASTTANRLLSSFAEVDEIAFLPRKPEKKGA